MIFPALNFVHFLEQITYRVPRPVEDDREGTALKSQPLWERRTLETLRENGRGQELVCKKHPRALASCLWRP